VAFKSSLLLRIAFMTCQGGMHFEFSRSGYNGGAIAVWISKRRNAAK